MSLNSNSKPSLANRQTTEPAALHYAVELFNPNAHQYRVRLSIAQPDPNGQRLSLPAWIPGSYLIRDFARNIVAITASSNGSAVALKQLDKHSWQADPTDGELMVECLVYAFDTSVRSAFIDSQRGFFNGTSLFLRVHGAENQPAELVLEQPSEPLSDWQVATGLTATEVNAAGFGRYRAENYQQLIDCPFEMGGAASQFERIEFEAAGVPHCIVLNGKHTVDAERLAADLTKICEQQVALFGDCPPFDRYLFLTQVTTASYGGLEHMNSTALVCARNDLPQPGVEKVTDGYRQFLGLCSHEYFHCWNIKRIKPLVFAEAFAKSDMQQEVYSGLLWAFEGITSYYDDLALVRCGLINETSYLELLGQTITRVYAGKGRQLQSIYDSSFNAWSKFYKQDANAANAIVSYYAKGCLVALSLDITLRQHGSSLDALMRELWAQYATEGLPEHGIQPIAEQLAGQSLQSFFDQYVYGTEDPPLEELLAEVGVKLHWRQPSGPGDKGGKPGDSTATQRVHLGAVVSDEGKVQTVTNNGPAEQAGLAPGDTLVAINGFKVNGNGDALLQRQAIGSEAELHLFRDEQLLAMPLAIQPAEKTVAYLTADNQPASQQTVRQRWLNT